MKSVIINADDYGLYPAVTRAILRAREAGIVTNTTVLANLCAPEDLRSLCTSGLACGLHANLIEGRPLTGTGGLETILNGQGYFAGIGRLARSSLAGRLNVDRLVEELEAQAAVLTGAGLIIDHMDSHQHAHHLPGVAEAVIEVMRHLGVASVRLAREPVWLPFGQARSVLKNLVLKPFVRFAGRRFQKAGFRMPHRFIGIALLEAPNPSEALGWTMGHLEEGVCEVALHLALDEAPGRMPAYTRSWSAVFAAAMQMDWKRALSQGQAVARSYGDAWPTVAVARTGTSRDKGTVNELPQA